MNYIKDLIQRLTTDHDWNQRFETQKHIERHGLSEEHFQETLKLLRESKDKEERYGAAEILGMIKDRRAVPALCESLGNDPDEYVRMRAARSLSHIPDVRSIPYLKKALNEDSTFNVKSDAANALMETAPQSLDAEEKIYCLLLNYKHKELEMLGNQILSVLLKALSEDMPKLQQLALRMLWKIDDPHVELVFLNFMERSNPHLRHESAIGLGEVGGVKAIPALYLALLDKEQDVKDRAADALLKIVKRNSQSKDILAHIPDFIEMLRGNQIHFRESALQMLILIGGPAAPALVQALPTVDWKMHRDACQALIEIGEPAVPALISALKEGRLDDSGAEILSDIISKCKDRGTIQDFEDTLAAVYDDLGREERRGKSGFQVAKLKMAIAKRKNQLAADKGVLLDDKPKPPKKGMYQQIRRLRNG